MKELIKKVPIPLSGLMLSIASLGNLLQSYSEPIRILCGIISGILCVLIVLKIIMYPTDIKEDLKNPIMASIAATFPMGLMLLSVYLKPLIGGMSIYLWFFAIALHVSIIILFTYRFMLKLDIKKVFASYFIVYVGIAVAGITAPAFNMLLIGKISFYFGFVSLLILLPLISYRYLKYPEILEPAKPVICIYAAPASLCLAAFMQSFENKHFGIVLFLVVLSSCLYIFVLIKLISLLKLKFYPSFASFTFPLVISAIAIKQAAGYLSAIGKHIALLQYVVLFETVFATLIVAYVLARFVQFFIKTS